MSYDTINRQEAINAVLRNLNKEEYRSSWESGAVKEMKNTLEKMPSADRPQGKWKAKSFHEFFCHNCGFSFDIMKCDFLENMKHCPNCGVRKGADDER